MGRIFAVFGVLMTLAACGVGGWVAARPPMKLLVVPGARDVEVVALGWGTWQISYHAPGAPATWYTDVAHQLEAQHWSSLDQVAYAPLTRTYSRVVSLGFCDLWEWAYLTFDPLSPHIARINVRRWLAIPWWRGQQFLNNPHLFRETPFASARSAVRLSRQPPAARPRRVALRGLV